MIRQNISIVLLIYFFLANNFLSQSISQIEIQGSKVYSESDYLKYIAPLQGKKIYRGIEDTLKKRIFSFLSNEGYYHSEILISIIPLDTINYKILININENEPTYIAKLFFNFSKDDSVYLTNSFKTLQNKIFNKYLIEETFKNILSYFENNGYPYASIKINSVYFYNDSTQNKNFVDIFLEINKDIKRKIDQIVIKGNTKTKDYVILRAIDINEGDYYSQKKIENIPYKLNKLNFFEKIDTPVYYINSLNIGVLKLGIKEKSTNNFDGIIGYVPKTESSKGYFTGFVNLSFRNLFGTSRSASIRWQRENNVTQEFEIKYIEPWIINLPFNVHLNFYQRIQDTTYIQQRMEGKIEYIATDEITASFIINSQPTIPIERNKKVFTVFNSQSLSTGFNLRIDTRDNYFFPRKGILFNNSYLFTSKKILGPQEFITEQTRTKINLQRYEFDFEYFKEIFFNQIAALKIHARELRGSDIEISDMYLLGGTNSLRGYKEKQFLGNRILWTNFEYRYLLSKINFLFVFLDSGYFLQSYNSSLNLSKSEGFKIGYGFGINLETAIGILNISFALAKGDSFSDGKIHFGIVSEL